MSCSDSFSRCCLLPVSNRKRMAISLAVSRQARNSPDTFFFFFSSFFKAPSAVSAGAFPHTHQKKKHPKNPAPLGLAAAPGTPRPPPPPRRDRRPGGPRRPKRRYRDAAGTGRPRQPDTAGGRDTHTHRDTTGIEGGPRAPPDPLRPVTHRVLCVCPPLRLSSHAPSPHLHPQLPGVAAAGSPPPPPGGP